MLLFSLLFSERKILMNFLSIWGGLWTCISCQETSKSRTCSVFIYSHMCKSEQAFKPAVLCAASHCSCCSLIVLTSPCVLRGAQWVRSIELTVRMQSEKLTFQNALSMECAAASQPALLGAPFFGTVPFDFSYGFFFFPCFIPSKLKTKMYLALQSLELDLSKMAGMYW